MTSFTRARRFGWILMLAVAGTACRGDGAYAQSATAVRVGDHSGFGRIVFDMPEQAGFEVVRDGDRMLIMFHGAGAVPQPMSLPRNVVSVQTGQDTATLLFVPGAQPRAARMGSRLVVDVYGPAIRAEPRTPPSVARVTRRPTANQPVPAATQPKSPETDSPAPPPAAQQDRTVGTAPPTDADPRPTPRPAEEHPPAPQIQPRQEATATIDRAAPTVPVQQEPLASPGDQEPAAPQPALAPRTPALLIPAAVDVGAAAFRRGDFGLVVLDRRIADGIVPEGGAWSPGAVSTTVQLPMQAGEHLGLTRRPDGWTVERVPAPAGGGIEPAVRPDGTALPLQTPGRVVTLRDPITGTTLLVGTSLTGGPATGLATGRHTPDYALLPSWLGVAVLPAADQVDLRAGAGQFLLLGSAVRGAAATTSLTRRFEWLDESAPSLANRLRSQLAGAAAAPPRARGPARVAAARSMIALGLAAEAQSLLQLASADDPQVAADAEVVGLRAIAALLARRLEEAGGLDDPRLDGTDEIALWRGLRDRWQGADTDVARKLGASAPIALTYPQTLRRLVWPEIAEAAVESGVPVASDKLSPYARAVALEREGRIDAALAAYDALIAGADRLDQVRAAARGTELRLASGRITAADAAASIERQAFAWRGDGREAGLRLRSAELRTVSGEWRRALETLREIETLYPDRRPAIQAGKAAVLKGMITAEGGAMSPLDLVLLAAEFTDAIPDGEQGGALARLLAERLLALDLPARAIPLLQGLVRAAPAGEPRAEFGAKLTQLLLDGGDVAGAATALAASSAPDISPGLKRNRGLLEARLLQAQGNVPAAAARLIELGTAEADDLRATMLAGVGDWRGAFGALSDLASKRVPAEGTLDPGAQEVLLRQAGAAAQIPDPAMLKALAPSAARLTSPRSEMFRVLTSAPVSAPGDLPRAARELVLARTVSTQLQALRPR